LLDFCSYPPTYSYEETEMAPSFSKSYMVTNRTYPSTEWVDYIYPLPPGTSYYYLAAGGNNPDPTAYKQINSTPSEYLPSAFHAPLYADLALAVANGGPQLTLYIHGLGNYFSDACTELGTFGANLASQGYKGLLMAFSWPSYSEESSYEWYGSLPYSFPPTATSGTIRDNINGSVQSLVNLLQVLAEICAAQRATLNVLCHSEGNYMLMLTLYAMAFPGPQAQFLGRVLSVAADINTGALLRMNPKSPWDGQGASMAAFATGGATVYWSSQDDVLPYSEGWTDYHNPSYPNRLGLHGPASFAVGALAENAYGLDCSAVVNQQVMNKTPQVPPGTYSHTAYFYMPQVLQDMAQTLAGVPPGKVANRVSAGAPNGQAYVMKLVPTALTDGFRPRGTRVERRVPQLT
jgi:esterase/lipase superfamily enzyme